MLKKFSKMKKMEMRQKTSNLVAESCGPTPPGLVALHTEFFVLVQTVLDANGGLAGCSQVASWTYFGANAS